MKIFTNISCCLNSFTRNCIELSIIILSAFGLLISIIGVAVIPWGYTSKAMEVFYLLSLILFFYSLIFPCIFKLSRKIKVNENKMAFCKINAFIIACACILCIFLNIFTAIGTIPDLKNKKSIENVEIIEPNGETKIITNEEKLATNKQLGFAIFSIIVNLILWILLLFLWIAEVIRLKYKIEGSYNDFILEQKNVSTASSQNPALNIIGHDKYGFPIYSKKSDDKIQLEKSKSEFNYKLDDKYNSKYDIETNNILAYSYKEKCPSKTLRNRNYKSVDAIHRLKQEQNEKYFEKYIENGSPNPYYSNFENKTALNMSTNNNSINPGY